jgi:hypothetical protein
MLLNMLSNAVLLFVKRMPWCFTVIGQPIPADVLRVLFEPLVHSLRRCLSHMLPYTSLGLPASSSFAKS